MSAETINSKLEQAYITDERAAWKLWLVTGDYDDAPKKRTDNRLNEGTAAPIQSFTSPFAGKTIEDAAEWLKNAPEDVDLNRMFFAVLDDRSESDDTITLCRIGDGGMEGKKGELQYFPEEAWGAQIYLETMMAALSTTACRVINAGSKSGVSLI
ncbi:hypothetical protein MMC16_000426 [Acarospora aff. strigata]|nr:hypothetical protein [Acarospora aff. strigata]